MMAEKLDLLKLVDEIDDVEVLKSIIKTHALTDGTREWNKETAAALSMDAAKRLSQTGIRIQVVALCIQSIEEDMPSAICQTIGE